MQELCPYVLTIAGFDPCGGAGVLADVKTFEQHKVHGLAIITGYTLQTENEFHWVEWRSLMLLKEELKVMLEKYPVKAIKFGIVPSIEFLISLIDIIRDNYSEIKIIIDPIWKSSTQYEFLKDTNSQLILNLAKRIDLITPNIEEIEKFSIEKSSELLIAELVKYTSVFVKGGHDDKMKGRDVLYDNKNQFYFNAMPGNYFSKHGSGCVLSAAITANIARGFSMKEACEKAKRYIEKYLMSNESLLGFHVE